MKKIVSIIGLLCCLFGVRAGEERNLLQNAADAARLREVIVSDGSWMPYPEYADRAGWDAFTGPNRGMLIRRGERYLDYEWKVVKATDYLEFERTGNRRIMEDPYGANNAALADLIVAELAEGKGRFIDQIVNGSYHLCEMTSWALSAHVKNQTSHRALPAKGDHVIALVSCEMGAVLAWAHRFFRDEFDKIDPSISARIRLEVKERIMDTFLERIDRFWWTGFKKKGNNTINNWNPWCNASIIQCFMLLENDPERLARAVHLSMASVDTFIDYVKSDGACEEGPAYWGHAAGKLYDYLRLLGMITDGKVSVFDNPMVRDMGEYIARSYVGNGWVVNFADATASGGGDAPLIYRYGKAVGSDEMCRYAAKLVEEKRSGTITFGRDLFRCFESLREYPGLMAAEPHLSEHAFTWYPETQFCYMRFGDMFLAMKGGHNNESHNHNDIGTFSLYVDNNPVLIDAGVGTYTRQTFSGERYTIWTMQSDYHNLPKINGVSQKNGARFKARDVRADERRREFSLDIAGAYPEEAGAKSWVRSYRMGRDEVTVTDNFVLENPVVANDLNFLTWGDVDITVPGTVRIVTPRGGKLTLSYDAAAFTPSLETVELSDRKLSNVWGPEVVRLTLRAAKVAAKGRYVCRLRAEK